MKSIRILADDLTGALDTAAAFDGEVPVYIDCPPVGAIETSVNPVSVVATPTRDVAVSTLGSYLAPVVEWFAAGDLPFKKVDSLLRGNTFAEIAWLLLNASFTRGIFAPAFPAQRRITVADRQWTLDRDGTKSAVAVPLVSAFAELGVRAGAMDDKDATIWIPDVRTDDDLDRVAGWTDTGAGAAVNDLLWVGSAGLGNALARRFGLAPRVGSVSSLPAGQGPTVLISASFQSVFREQWALLRTNSDIAAVAAEAGDAEGIVRAVDAARAGASDVWFDLSPRHVVKPEEARRRLDEHTRMLVDRLPVPGRLLVIGGDTLLGLCRASGATGLLARASIRSGWGCARLMGGVWDGVLCYSRSGAFGVADDLLAMFGVLNHTSPC